MTTNFFSANSENGASLSVMPTHAAGDDILIFAFRDGSATLPGTGAGYTSIITESRNLISARLGHKVAASSSETSGTWTNADLIVCQVYRGNIGIGASITAKGSSTSVSIPSLTLNVTDGSSWVAGFGGHADTGGSLATPPAGMTNRTTIDGSAADGAGYDTNGGVTTYAGGTVTHTNTGEWIGISLEITGAFDALGNQFFFI